MSCHTTTIRLTNDEREFLEERCISLTKFVRINIKKMKETDSASNPKPVSMPTVGASV